MKYNVYIDSCTEHGGIYHYETDENGEVTFINKTLLDKPMYSVIEGDKFYTVLRSPFGDEKGSAVIVHEMQNDKIGNEIYFAHTLGKEGCHLAVKDGDVFVTNYTSGSLFKTPDILKVHKDREYKGENVDLKRQEMPHTHCVILTPDEKYIAVTDLGLDKIFIYDFDFNLISETKVEDGFGPRHIIFDGDILYCLCELKHKLLSFKYDEGKLTEISQADTLPEDFNGYDIAAAVRIKGNKIYASNRGNDTVAVFKNDEGYFEKIGFIKTFGKGPRDFNIAGDILICANEESGTVTFFKLNEKGLADKPYLTLYIERALGVVIKEK